MSTSCNPNVKKVGEEARNPVLCWALSVHDRFRIGVPRWWNLLREEGFQLRISSKELQRKAGTHGSCGSGCLLMPPGDPRMQIRKGRAPSKRLPVVDVQDKRETDGSCRGHIYMRMKVLGRSKKATGEHRMLSIELGDQ
jgi:hypothetical protein